MLPLSRYGGILPGARGFLREERREENRREERRGEKRREEKRERRGEERRGEERRGEKTSGYPRQLIDITAPKDLN